MSTIENGTAASHDLPSLDDPYSARLETRFEVPRLQGFTDLLQRTIDVFRENFKLIVLVALVLMIPLDVMVSFCDAFTVGDDGMQLLSSIGSLVQNIMAAFAAPAIIYAMIIRMRDGREVSLGEALSWSGKAGMRTLGYRILAGLIIGLGTLLLIIPGLIFMTWYALVDVVVATEGKGHPGVLSRSKFLSMGRRWWIFGMYALLGVGMFAIGIIGGIFDELIWSQAEEVWSVHGALSFLMWLVFSSVMSVLMWLFTAMAVVVYMDGVGTHLLECPSCGYNLTGNVSGACSECGQAIPEYIQQLLLPQTDTANEPWSA